MPAPVLPMLEGFFATYVDCLQRSDVADEQAEFVELLDFYAGQAPPRRALRAAVRGSRTELRPSLFAGEFEQQLVEPFVFKPFHEGVSEPHDYYALTEKFFTPLIDADDSKLVGEANLRKMQEQLAAGEASDARDDALRARAARAARLDARDARATRLSPRVARRRRNARGRTSSCSAITKPRRIRRRSRRSSTPSRPTSRRRW